MADFKALIAKVAERRALTREEAEAAFDVMMSGEATPAQMGGFLMALRVRGETVDEIAGAVAAMRAKMLRVEAPPDAIDIVGTGGDGRAPQHLHRRGLRRRRRRRPRRQARQPRALVEVRRRRRADRARRQDRCSAPEAVDALHRRGRHRLHVRAGASRGDEACRPDAGRARHPHDLQPARAADQSGRRQAPADRRLLAPTGSSRSAEVLGELGSERAWVVHGAGGARRDLDRRRDQRSPSSKDGEVATFDGHARGRGLARAARRDQRRRRQAQRRGAARRAARRDRAPIATSSLLNAAAALVVAGKARDLARRRRARRQRSIDEGRAARAPGTPRRRVQRADAKASPSAVMHADSDRATSSPGSKRQARRSRRSARPRAAGRDRAPPAARRRRAASSRALEREHRRGRPALIAEIKKASPSKGLIRADFDPPALARAYAGGRRGLPVGADRRPIFQGAPEHLVARARRRALPVLRKDFLFDPYQVVEARALGADCILIILAARRRRRGPRARGRRRAISAWTCWSRCTTRTSSSARLRLESPLVGINNRDLKTFATDARDHRAAGPRVPADRVIVAESGIFTPADLAGWRRAGVSAYPGRREPDAPGRRRGRDRGAARSAGGGVILAL